MSSVPSIPPVFSRANRPFWSVMIPTYRPKENYLRQALESALQQDPGADQMQIEVVDDSSPDVDVEAMVKSIGGGRVAFSRTPKNLGLAGCWNTCIERSRGQWVHILHQDDYVLPGFYQKLARLAKQLNAEVALMATRSFVVDAQNTISSVTPRFPELETPGKTVSVFYDGNPIQCPGVVVRRTFYEAAGGFRADLVYTLDWEMWTRATALGGGVVIPDVLACYRHAEGSETFRLHRLADSARDASRIIRIYAESYPGYDLRKAQIQACNAAISHARRFSKLGETEAAKVNWDYCRKTFPLPMRLRILAGRLCARMSKWLWS